jgi:hypothetical protein
MDGLFRSVEMKLIQSLLVLFLACTTLVSAGARIWTREVYDETIQNSSIVFNAKVVEQSREYFHNGKKIDVPERGDISKYFESGKEMPVVHTKITLEITSVDKGDSYKVGEKIEVNWKDSAFVLCPHTENESLNGKERKWHDVGNTYKILPEALHKKVGDIYVLVAINGEQAGNEQPATISKPEGKEKPQPEAEGRSR